MPAFIPVVGAIIKWTPWVVGAVYAAWSYLPPSVTMPFTTVTEWVFGSTFDWLLSVAKDIADGVASKISAVVPEGWVPSFDTLKPYLGFLDYVMGLQSLVKLVVVYYGVLMVIGVIRTVRGLMPRLSAT